LAVSSEASSAFWLKIEKPIMPPGPKEAASRSSASTPGTSLKSKSPPRKTRMTARISAQTPTSTIR